MAMLNGTHPALDARIEAMRSGVRKLMDRVSTQSSDSRLARFASSATATIKKHPLAAAAIALGAGYLIVRIARRRES